MSYTQISIIALHFSFNYFTTKTFENKDRNHSKIVDSFFLVILQEVQEFKATNAGINSASK